MKCRFLCTFLLLSYLSSAIPQTVGLVHNDPQACDGYTLFAPLSGTTTYLIDNQGCLMHAWPGDYTPGNSVYLLPGGVLLRTAALSQQENPVFTAGGRGGRIEMIDWQGSITWAFEYCNDQHCHHHDIEMLPNGNILMIAWERKTRAEAIEAGRNPNRLKDNELWPDHIIEIEPQENNSATVVWEWHVWDHLIQDYDNSRDHYGNVGAHPELIDINYQSQAGADWNHLNAIDYNADLDQIILSSRTFSEIWIIDHSTTTAEAAGHSGGRYGQGGDLLYRWGNPRAHRAGSKSDQQLFGQHDAQWIADNLPGQGNILLFNNGDSRIGLHYSTVDELVLPLQADGSYSTPALHQAFAPETPHWTYQADDPQSFYSHHISGVQRLANGNTLICEGASGKLFEVTPDGEIVWIYINPVTGEGIAQQGTPADKLKNNSVFRAWRYDPDYSAFDGKPLTAGDPIEQESPAAVSNSNAAPHCFDLQQNYPNPFNGRTRIDYTLDAPQYIELLIVNALGQEVRRLVEQWKQAGNHSVVWDGCNNMGKQVDSGIYFYRLSGEHGSKTAKMILMH